MIGVVGEQHRPTLIQVVARRTAEPDGVADFALALARALRAAGGGLENSLRAKAQSSNSSRYSSIVIG